ncbi:hypothetical protein ACIA49_33190 [Kribbella sp. NPDC051587]|uniref:hypothetical protein n=1 Tax=Kribbella sp. NPDC051587 TaxID=3364119 RepID=UPI0037BC5636
MAIKRFLATTFAAVALVGSALATTFRPSSEFTSESGQSQPLYPTYDLCNAAGDLTKRKKANNAGLPITP